MRIKKNGLAAGADEEKLDPNVANILQLLDERDKRTTKKVLQGAVYHEMPKASGHKNW